eukprot:5693446-Amphidinium_carterae.1
MVRACRAEEITWMREHGTNKGDAERPNYRSRLCARETRRSGGCEGMAAQLFAATPPLEGFRCLLSMAMGREYSRNGLPLKLGFIDIKKAH